MLQTEAECLCAREDEVARSKTPTICILRFISFIRNSSNGHWKYMKKVPGIKENFQKIDRQDREMEECDKKAQMYQKNLEASE